MAGLLTSLVGSGTLKKNSNAVVAKAINGQVVVADQDGQFKVPAPRAVNPRGALKQKVLDEDTYTDAMKRIVERDYFPELPYLRAKQELDDAIQSRDPVRVRAAQGQLRRAAVTPSGRAQHTPGRAGMDDLGMSSVRSHGFREPGTPMRGGHEGIGGCGRREAEQGGEGGDEVQKIVQGKSLDGFVRKYTSEDNYAASEIMLNDEVAMEQARAWVHEHANEFNKRQTLLIENGPKHEDATLNMQVATLYTEKQSLMHMVPHTNHAHKQSADQRSRPEPAISKTATRIRAAPLAPPPGGASSGGYAPSVPASPRVGGYGFLCTPSPAPGQDGDDPMFTYGLIEGTPLILHDDDPAPHYNPFSVQAPTAKEQVAEKLLNKAKAKHATPNRRSTLGSQYAGAKSSTRPGTPGTPGGGGARTPGTPRLGAAAQKLASRLGMGTPKDSMLRRSYAGTPVSGTPREGTPMGGTPRGGTPRGGTPARGGTPGVEEGGVGKKRASAGEMWGMGAGGGGGGGAAGGDGGGREKKGRHLTDGLLNI